jgi:hypothetical protein
MTHGNRVKDEFVGISRAPAKAIQSTGGLPTNEVTGIIEGGDEPGQNLGIAMLAERSESRSPHLGFAIIQGGN